MTGLAFHVLQFVPDCTDPDEMEQRQALLKARSYAGRLCASREAEMAYQRATLAREVADAFVFADVPTDRLKIAVGYCRNLVHSAFFADHLEREGLQ